MKKLITICLVCICLLSTVSTVFADDILPPPWRTYSSMAPGSTAAGWENWTGYPFPQSMYSDWAAANPPTGSFMAYAEAEDAVFHDVYEGRQNVIELTADNQLIFTMPNFENENPLKHIWLQVTYFPTSENEAIEFGVGNQYGDIQGRSTSVLENSILQQDGWLTEAWSFDIWPNVSEEYIIMNFYDSFTYAGLYPAYVDQVVIDTWCVPEPATICLLGLGALSLIRRKK